MLRGLSFIGDFGPEVCEGNLLRGRILKGGRRRWAFIYPLGSWCYAEVRRALIRCIHLTAGVCGGRAEAGRSLTMGHTKRSYDYLSGCSICGHSSSRGV